MRDRGAVEVLERKGLYTKQDLFDIIIIITELRKQNPRAKIPETTFPEPYLLTETENRIIDEILALLNKNDLTSHQSLSLLEQLGGIIEMGQRLAEDRRTDPVPHNAYSLQSVIPGSAPGCSNSTISGQTPGPQAA